MGSGGHSSGNFLTEKTAVLGLRAYVLVVIAAVALLTGGLAALFLFIRSRSRGNRLTRWKLSSGLIPTFMMDIDDTALERGGHRGGKKFEGEKKMGAEVVEVMRVEEGGKGAGESSGSKAGTEIMGNIGWGRWYTMEELDTATGRFAQWNVIGEGGYGVVYRGVLPDLTVVAIKNLLNKKGQAEKEFKVEVEVIGRVRHKNLVGLLGYCAEGPKRLLVYEYMDNGNLEQWLHGEIGPVSQLTWEIRMKIAIGTAKGLAHLHEGLEPKVVHRDIKSSNILLDKYWNPKVSDFGLAKLLGPGSNYVSTRVMGTFGYVAPEYASTGMLNESSDIYSFGVLLMEIITGRSPVDYRRPTGEVNLVEWFRGMVGSKHVDDVLDPSIEVQPSPRALKKALLVCLRCVDLDAQKRPRMGQVAHMLEGDEFPFRQEHRPSRKVPQLTGVPASDTPTATVRLPLITDKLGFNPLERSLWR